jgi:hypothetical protein
VVKGEYSVGLAQNSLQNFVGIDIDSFWRGAKTVVKVIMAAFIRTQIELINHVF